MSIFLLSTKNRAVGARQIFIGDLLLLAPVTGKESTHNDELSRGYVRILQGVMAVRHLERGFTILELLAVLALIGIVTAVSAAGWYRTRQNLEANSLAKQLQGALQAARFEAMKRNRPVSFVLEGTEFITRAKDDTTSTTCGNEAGDTILSRLPTDGSPGLGADTTVAGDGLIWDKDGSPQLCGGALGDLTINVTQDGATVRQIAINSAGRVSQ
ncbi:GspH/FimT family pseudopilin [Synechococcus sp. PCC 7336]|uniref:GspH/FimT family pseudopilin n=1 Tax=Synechococcus sp. PCC 7336 TaxID=195250 RepID=UPI000375A516|nr:GspH/FimT family pseudopilin [Synechococcus sp. PCC 7336]